MAHDFLQDNNICQQQSVAPPPLNPPRLRYSDKQDLLASFSNQIQRRLGKVGGFRYTSGCNIFNTGYNYSPAIFFYTAVLPLFGHCGLLLPALHLFSKQINGLERALYENVEPTTKGLFSNPPQNSNHSLIVHHYTRIYFF